MEKLAGNVCAKFDRVRGDLFRGVHMRTDYDARTAIAFLLAGLGLGTLITLIFAPRESADDILSEFRSPRLARSRAARAV